jgi:hypothetical protein
VSTDEVWVAIAGWVVGLLAWARWYLPLIGRARFRSRSRWSDVLCVCMPPACLALVFLVLRTVASEDVRHAPQYLVMYLGLGAGWVGALQSLTIWLGVGGRDDAVERENPAAAVAVCGSLAGLALCYAGGNIGNGPGWWVVVFCAALASLALGAAWWLLEAFTSISQRVTVDRDVAAGLRLAAFLAGSGLILGRAVAGDWVSANVTVTDFVRLGWPVLIFIPVEVVCSKAMGRSIVVAGVFPAIAYAAGAAWWVTTRGAW